MTWDDITYFTPDEFTCRCGLCNGGEMDLEFVNVLDAIRGELGFALPVNSGYRCPGYNASISSTGADGPHTTGRAADIGVSGEKAYKLIRTASLYSDITGIGIAQKGAHGSRFIHLDTLTTMPRPWIWTY